MVTILILIDGFLQFKLQKGELNMIESHNPYFNRWFSAILAKCDFSTFEGQVTILILIDGFLQY